MKGSTSNFYSCSMEKIKAVEEILVQNVVINFQLIFISFFVKQKNQQQVRLPEECLYNRLI